MFSLKPAESTTIFSKIYLHLFLVSVNLIPDSVLVPFAVHYIYYISWRLYKTFSVFLSSYRNTSGVLGEREMLWEHEPQVSVSTAFSSSLKPSRVFL